MCEFLLPFNTQNYCSPTFYLIREKIMKIIAQLNKLIRNHNVKKSSNVKKSIKKSLVLWLLMWTTVSFADDNQLTPEEKTQGWQLLFNGTDISQWRNFKESTINKEWKVDKGTMILTGKDGGDILTKKTYKNFDLKLDWKISTAGNSGIFIMADEFGSQIYSHAIEIQILDNELHPDNKLDSHLSGSVYDIIAAPTSAHKKANEWNQVRILVENKRLQVWQNGVAVSDIVIGSERWNKRVAKSKFNDWEGFALSEVGHIGLQDHGDVVSFKNIKIKEL